MKPHCFKCQQMSCEKKRCPAKTKHISILSRHRPTNLCRKFCFATSLSVRARLKTELARFQMALHLVEVEQLVAALVVAGQGEEAHQSVQGKVWGVHHGLLGFVSSYLTFQLNFIPACILYTFAGWHSSNP